MKKIIIFLICFSFLPLLGEMTLNEYGQINSVKEEIDLEYSYEDFEYYVQIDKLKLVGTSVFPIARGYLAIVTEHENHPTCLRIYDKEGNEKPKKSFLKTINTKLSENKNYATFSTGERLIVLNLENLEIAEFINSINFAVNDQSITIFVDRENKIHFQNQIYSIQKNISLVQFQNEFPLIITKHSIYKIDSNIEQIYFFKDEIFDEKIIKKSA